MKKNKKTVIIMGMERSGTSITAKICDALGINMGVNGSSTISVSCPNGNYEDKEFVKIIKDIYKNAGGHHWDPPQIEAILEGRKLFEKDIKTLIKRKNNENDEWGWKYPWTPLVIDLFSSFLDNPHYIIIFRNPLGVARSAVSHTRGVVNFDRGLEIANFYNNILANFIKKNIDSKKILILSFEDLIKDINSSTKEIASFLNINPTKEMFDEINEFFLPRNKINRKKTLPKINWFIRESLRLIKEKGFIFFLKTSKNYISRKITLFFKKQYWE